MGLALVIGVATKIYVKKSTDFKEYTKDEIIKQLDGKLNMNLYDVRDCEEDKMLVFTIKKEIFKNNIYDFLVSETKNLKWKGKHREELNQILEKIKGAKDTESIMNIVKEEGSYYLHIMTGNPWETISYIGDGDLSIIATLLTYSFSYKVILEEYCDLFRYIRSKLQDAIDNPLKDDVFLMITTG
mgnify:CR=1 FL=1